MIFNNEKNQETEIKEKQNKNVNNEKLPETSTLVIATNSFDREEYDHLDIRKNEFLIVTDWNYREGWVFGHRKNNEKEKGIFPKVLIKIYDDENKGNP